MVEILIIGLALFIVGVGATIIWDKYKDGIKLAFEQAKQTTPKVNRTPPKVAAALPKTVQQQKVEVEDVIKKLRASIEQQAQRRAATIGLPTGKPPRAAPTPRNTVSFNEFVDMMEGRRPDLHDEWFKKDVDAINAALKRDMQRIEDDLDRAASELDKATKRFFDESD